MRIDIVKAIGAVFDWNVNNDDEALFSRCRESNVSVNDAIYLTAVFRAIEGGIRQGLPLLLGGRQTATFVQEVRKAGARIAANARHDLPMPTVKALEAEYADVQEKLGNDARPTTVYKDMSKTILGDKKYWRRIRTQLQK